MFCEGQPVRIKLTPRTKWWFERHKPPVDGWFVIRYRGRERDYLIGHKTFKFSFLDCPAEIFFPADGVESDMPEVDLEEYTWE